MADNSQSDGDVAGGSESAEGELRAFTAAQVGGHSWVVDLLPNYTLTIGRNVEADVRIDVPNVADAHATLNWDGEQNITVADLGSGDGITLNGEPVTGTAPVSPGDEIVVGPATLVVNITFAPATKGRRSLTHQEFSERVTEELSRARRTRRPTCLVMLKSRSGDGSSVAAAALSSFRGGDIVGTYAHDEIEFLLPDTPPNIGKAVIERLLESAGARGASVGLAVSPEDGDSAEWLMRAGRDALATSIEQGGGLARTGAQEFEAGMADIHTDATRHVLEEIEQASEAGEPVLMMGEPNAGKRYYAHLLHDKSIRRDGPFVLIHCAGLVDSDSLTRAFGPATGELSDCQAESAQGGTLLLEEIGDLPLQGQRRLLRLFEEGSEDYNVVSTTHRDLSALCQVGAFQRELFDKIGGRKVRIPALRMRAESIVPLAQNFAQQFETTKVVKLSDGAIDKMRGYSWPGNVLELRNAMERAVTLADGGEILAEHLPGDPTDQGDKGMLRDHVGSVERDAIIKALADNNYNQTHAAKLLGISRRALIYKMEKYGLKPPPAGSKK